MVKADQHGPSNLLSTPIEGNAANYSLNGSASGSKNGSNEQNGNSAAVINEGTNMESDNAVDGKCRGGGGNGSRSGVDQNQVTPREAALNKFRQKRKDRCFEKKVRYQSRKKLAEQRPRVRGQFVRQVVSKNESKEKDS
jgi:pseudo-response regulator 7